jgi:uncharacterized membrane protein YgdD (TMEM256/DUF423 family)
LGGWALGSVKHTTRLETWETAVRYQMYHALAHVPQQQTKLDFSEIFWGVEST